MCFSFLLAAFVAGICVEYFRVFPYTLVHNAKTAFKAVAIAPKQQIDGPFEFNLIASAPVARWKSEQRSDECILMITGSSQFPNLNPDGALAQLIDRDGACQHQWNNDPDLWSELNHVTRVPGVSGVISPVSLHLYDNGDLLASFHGFNTFPYAIGLAKFDKNSQLLWKRENFCHHCFSVTRDGRIFVPSMEVVDSPISLGETTATIYSTTGKIYRDVVLELNSSGEEIARVDVLDALIHSGWAGQFIRGNILQVETDDPLHLNDVRIVGDRLSAKFGWLKPDDLLISLRNLNCLAILDFSTKRIKWISCGAVIGQHSPRILGDSLLVLDNLGGNQAMGGSRLVRIEIERGIPATFFPEQAQDLPDSMRTINSGYLDISPNEKRVLATVTHAGCIWEVDVDSRKVVWEYIAGAKTRDQSRLKIGFAKYVTRPSFLMQPNETSLSQHELNLESEN